jgi:hypothetical protein
MQALLSDRGYPQELMSRIELNEELEGGIGNSHGESSLPKLTPATTFANGVLSLSAML